MMDDAEREGLRLALKRAMLDRDRADATISFLTEKLGIAAPTGSAELLSPGEAPDGGEMRDVGPVHVQEGEFYGYSQTKAAAAFLERAGRSRPQKTEQIIAAIAKGGVHIGGKDPEGNFYKILNRNPLFRRVGTSLWGLAAFYPNMPKKPAKADQSAEAQESEPEASTDAEEGAGAPTDDDTPDWLKETASAEQ